jgi:hypothetical protein
VSTVRITSRALIPDQGGVTYSIFAPKGSNIPNGTVITVPGISGLTATLSEDVGNGMTYCVQNVGGGTQWDWAGNFALNSPVIHSQTGFAQPPTTAGPLQWVFSLGIAGFGCQIQANFYGAFTALIQAYDVANALLGSFTVNGVSNNNQDNSCVFLGILSTANDIRKIRMDVTVAAPNPHDFGINNPNIYQVFGLTGATRPSTLVLFPPAIAPGVVLPFIGPGGALFPPLMPECIAGGFVVDDVAGPP